MTAVARADVADVGHRTDEVRVGMLGCGFIGEFHALGLRYVRGARISVNADADATRAAAYAERVGSRPIASIEALVNDPEVDLVLISLPNQFHLEAVRAAAAAGKAVACTKPLGRNATEAAEMLRAVDEAGVFNAYLENVVFNPDLVRMRQMIEAGAVGRLTTVRAREGHSGPHAAHFWNAEVAGGGALLDVMCLGVTRIGATATKPILDDFKARKANANTDAAGITGGALEQGTY